MRQGGASETAASHHADLALAVTTVRGMPVIG